MGTTDKTVARLLESLINDHVENHDPEIPHVMGQMDGSEANVSSVTVNEKLSYPTVHLELTDGTRFALRVQRLK